MEVVLPDKQRDFVRAFIPKWDIDSRTFEIVDFTRSRSKTGFVRLMTLVDAVRYVVRQGIQGDVVECGVWRGGSMMAAALALQDELDLERKLYMYDTFEGMPDPTPEDLLMETGEAAVDLLEGPLSADIESRADLTDVMAGMRSTGFPDERTIYVPGKVEDTIPDQVPEKISILRLDTDYYSSTKHELEHLYPRLAVGGILIVDDYGWWAGSRRATDEYFANQRLTPFMSRVDEARLMVKLAQGEVRNVVDS